MRGERRVAERDSFDAPTLPGDRQRLAEVGNSRVDVTENGEVAAPDAERHRGLGSRSDCPRLGESRIGLFSRFGEATADHVQTRELAEHPRPSSGGRVRGHEPGGDLERGLGSREVARLPEEPAQSLVEQAAPRVVGRVGYRGHGRSAELYGVVVVARQYRHLGRPLEQGCPVAEEQIVGVRDAIPDLQGSFVVAERLGEGKRPFGSRRGVDGRRQRMPPVARGVPVVGELARRRTRSCVGRSG